jgi:molybdate transport system substrate-binding protein
MLIGCAYRVCTSPLRSSKAPARNMMGKLVSLNPALWLVALSLSGCGSADSANRSGRPVMLFAAASTADALDEITGQFRRQHGVDVQTSYAGTAILARQVINGAGAHVFLSASNLWADELGKEGLVAKRRDLLGNRLVVIVSKPWEEELRKKGGDSRIQVQKPEDLLDEKVKYIALAEPRSVPAGMYAKQALVKLGLWEQLQSKIVAAADVRRALTYVERGEAEVGLVYATDASVSEAVRVALEIAPDLTGPIRYPVLLLKEGSGNQAAESFYEYLNSAEAAEVFQKHGFIVHRNSISEG